MYGNANYSRIGIELGHQFPVIMLTRTRYKCAGWHVVKKYNGDYLLMLPHNDEVGMKEFPTLERALDYILDEFYVLGSHVEKIEKERNAKVRPGSV